jgi:hypothetical protein
VDPDSIVLNAAATAVWSYHGVLITKVIRSAAATETDTYDNGPQPAHLSRRKLREHHLFPFMLLNTYADSTIRRQSEP